MSIAKEEESNCDGNNESLEATKVWQRMAKNMLKILLRKHQTKQKL